MKNKNSPGYDKLFKIRKFLDLHNPERNYLFRKPLQSSRVKSVFASLFQSSLAALESSVSHLLRLVLAMDLSVKYLLEKKMAWYKHLGR